MTRSTDQQPTPVPATAIPVGQARAPWGWTEPSVWTERMLTALEEGVKGGIWYSLIDKVYTPGNLESSLSKVMANEGAAGVDHITVTEFAAHRESNLKSLTEGLRDGTYVPHAVQRVYIPKPGSTEQRPLGIPTVRDRVVQGALRHVLEPIFERDFAAHSYGFRPGRGCKDALRRVEELRRKGYRYVVDADLKSYFDTIPHDRLLGLLRQKVADGRVLALVEAFLKAGILEGLDCWEPEAGAPQGAVLSPLLSNIYLDPLDQMLAVRGYEMVRYADDFVVLCRSEEEARRALAEVQAWAAAAGLTLHPTKTRIVDGATDGFDFLGYHFQHGRHWPRRKSLAKLKATIRQKTRRTSGQSLSCIIGALNQTLRGWFGYFRHSVRSVFVRLDKWIRMRLRSVLRKREKRRGRGRGSDHVRWPNAFFATQGLYSLVQAHATACQSSMR
jgi:RNA-directed DNA polymerase